MSKKELKIVVLTPREAKKLKTLIAKAELAKERLSKDRDKLRDIVSDLEDILDSISVGKESFDFGLRSLQDAVDRMSEYV